MPFIGKLPDVGAFRLIDSITTSATDTYALQVEGLSYFPSSARNLIVSLNGVTQAPESAYTVSGSNIIFASALTASDVIDYILVIGESVDIGTPSDNTVGNAQLKSDLDFSGKTLTFSADQISGDAINGGTISSFASTGIDDNATSTAITIDASENVGISVAPSAKIHAYDSNTTGTTIVARFDGNSAASNTSSGFRVETAGVTGNRHTRLYSAGTTQELRTYETSTGNRAVDCFFGISAGHITFDNGDGTTEYGRFDSSGNLLVGKTDSDTLGTIGHELHNSGMAHHTRSTGTVLYLNRTGNDGTIANFRKDNTTVGSIGTSASIAGKFFIAGESGLQFRSDDILPTNSNGAYTNGALDVGDSGARFRNGYFSGSIFAEGGVVVGGTAAANHLDDYEEGTWTPQLTDGTNTVNLTTQRYVKIGGLVTFMIGAYNISTTSLNASASLRINGFPFAPIQEGNNLARISSTTLETAFINSPSSVYYSNLYGKGNGGSNVPTLTLNNFASTSVVSIWGSVTYMVA